MTNALQKNVCSNTKHYVYNLIICFLKGTVYSNWTRWSSCSVSCGEGRRTRSRKCISGTCWDLDDSENCYSGRKCVQTRYSNWSRWSPCSVSCGEGRRTRSRKCISGRCWDLDDSENCDTGKKCPQIYCGKEFANLILKSGVCKTYGWRTRENGGWCKLYEELSEPGWTIEEMDECGSYEECCGEGCDPETEISAEECF